jgi:hypothetical protein
MRQGSYLPTGCEVERARASASEIRILIVNKLREDALIRLPSLIASRIPRVSAIVFRKCSCLIHPLRGGCNIFATEARMNLSHAAGAVAESDGSHAGASAGDQ